MNKAQNLLKKHFGYDNFRPGQETIINHILNHEDCLAIMPTGAGKSICYQIPAIILPGITIVISPLISLMKDQVDSLNEVGIPATYINSSLSYTEYSQTIENIKNNIYKIIYVAPERLNSETFINLLNSIEISMFTIDEAHCVSQWGHDFRPSYKEISNVIQNLNTRPIVSAFTATATQIVKNDIIKLLHLSNPFSLTSGFDRQNLKFSVQTPTSKKDFVLDYINKNSDKSGIIYCATRKSVDSLYSELSRLHYSISKYHGGMDEKSRTKSQEDFVYDRTTIMIATNAFGMGIDKSNIRYVIHFNMPKDLESYYQEAGRAGRDGDNSECILLFSRADIVTNKFLIENSSQISVNKIEYNKLNDIVDYCNTDKCLRKYILEYFNETPSFEMCNNCSNCLSTTEVTDITLDSKKILSCIKRMNERFGSGVVTDVLKGSKSAKVKSFGFDKLSTYGIMSEYNKDAIKDMIYFLVTEGAIKTVGDKYPILMLDNSANDILFHGRTVLIKRKFDKSVNVTKEEIIYDENLFSILKNLRKQIAEKHQIPPFIIFTDVSLKQMSTYYPITVEKMLKIDGVGAHKLENYGTIFIDAINNYVIDNNIKIPEQNQKIITKKEVKIESIQKENTNLISYNLYISGKSIDEIATERNLTIQTVQGHLLKCFELGMDISIEQYIHLEFEDAIYKAMYNIGYEKLKPLKESLPPEVTYFDIKYFIIKYEKTHNFSI